MQKINMEENLVKSPDLLKDLSLSLYFLYFQTPRGQSHENPALCMKLLTILLTKVE